MPFSKYIPFKPTPKQWAFLCYNGMEAFYGGSAGGGKSVALLMAGLQYVDVPHYSALLLRRTFTDLSLPGALMSMAREWLNETDAVWNAQKKSWVFPSGATLTFGFLESEDDKYRYQSSEFQFVGFDELSQFSETQYLYLFSRVRRLLDCDVPLRVRSASNPGGYGHEWVKNRFITPIDGRSRVYIPARLDDNPYLDKERYCEALSHLDVVTREQLLHGDWAIQVEGNFLKRQWFEIVEDYPRQAKMLRYWDKASSVDHGDYTAGALVAEKDGVFYLVDMIRVRESSHGVENLIKQTADRDGCPIRMEQEPGSSGADNVDHYARHILPGYDFKGIRSTGDKVTRAGIVSSTAEAGNLKIVRGSWIGAFLDEAVTFPQGEHDDQIDALSGAMNALANRPDPNRFNHIHVGKYGGGGR